MRSRAHIKSHPLHPILINFPIAFFTGTLAFDILGVIAKNASFHTTAFYLLIAGVGTGLLAAVPGLIDFLYTVPPKSSAKERASQHALLMVCMLALFSGVLAYRIAADFPSMFVVIALESLPFFIMVYAGWLGGTLVHRNQIGVDPRYAFAGKWKEIYLPATGERTVVGKSDDLKRDQMMLVHIAGKRIVVARTEEGYLAFNDHCTHRGGSLAGGMMICGTVQCPWHGSQFSARTGAVTAGPATEKISTYKIEVLDNIIYLHL